MRHTKYKPPRIRWFICPKCKYKKPATKRADQMTTKGHRKTMWCPMCAEKRTFIQISN